MLAAKMELLLKKLEDNPETAPVQALDTRMTCEVCGNTGHSGNSCPETRPEDANFIGNSSNLQQREVSPTRLEFVPIYAILLTR